MKRKNIYAFTSELEQLITKHMKLNDDENFGSFASDYLAMSIFELHKKNDTLDYNYINSVMGAAGLIELDQMCVWENTKKILPLFDLIISTPSVFDKPFGDADFFIRNIKSEFEDKIGTLCFEVKNNKSGRKGFVKYEITQFNKTVTFSDIESKKTFFEAKYEDWGELKEYMKHETVFTTDFRAKYDYNHVWAVNGIYGTLLTILTCIEADPECLSLIS